MTSHQETTRLWADLYRRTGYNVLPSDPSKKKPLCRFAQWWEYPAPDDLFDRFPTTNIQVMCGVHWNLAVLDLDGPDAVQHAEENWPSLPPTWTVFHSDGGRSGRHHWFTLPRGSTPRKRTVLWKGKGEHSAIELLVDHSLVMAPPSIHPKTGNEYGFLRRQSPVAIPRPALIPGWLWRMPTVEKEKMSTMVDIPSAPRPVDRPGINLDYHAVLDSIHDKAQVAREFGLRFAQAPQECEGWVSVHDFNREDRNPSARFHKPSGRFWRPGEKCINLLQLGVELGCYRDWQECRDALAGRQGLLRGTS